MVKELLDADFDHEVTASKGLVVVDCWAPWCGPCVRFAPIFEEVSKEYEGRVQFMKCNIEENPNTGTRMSIRSIPTLTLFLSGVKIDSAVGALSADRLREWLDDYLNRATDGKLSQ